MSEAATQGNGAGAVRPKNDRPGPRSGRVRPPRRVLRLLSPVTRSQALVYAVLGVLGALVFFGIWEAAHYLTAEESRRVPPSPQHVIATHYWLIAEKGYLSDIGISAYRIFVSFFAACALAIPLGVFMGCFANMRAAINPTFSGARYLPAGSFIPLLLVWFGPADTQKEALLAEPGYIDLERQMFAWMREEIQAE